MSRITRRHFLSSAAATAAIAGSTSLLHSQTTPDAAPTPPASAPAARRLKIAIIGVTGRGGSHVNEVRAIKEAEVIALCDVDSAHLASAQKKIPTAKGFKDFRDCLKMPGLEAVLVSTPDHTHAVITAAALKAGLHVYCEKPLAHTVKEVRAITKLAAANPHLCTQLGIQIHSLDNYRRVVELIQGGAIGKVTEVHLWNNRSIRTPDRTHVDPPATLDYNLWLGPVVQRPYEKSFHPFSWRRYWAFGEGLMGDIGCHYLDLPFWALGLRQPTKVSATSPGAPKADGDITPESLIVHYEFAAPSPVTLTWYDPPHKPEKIADWKLPPSLAGEGVMFLGDRGMLCTNYSEHVLLPEDQYKSYARPPKTIPSSPGQQAEWIRACLDKNPSISLCNFSYGGPLSETALLGPVAYRAGKPLTWDAKSMTFPDAKEAEALLDQERRPGWEL